MFPDELETARLLLKPFEAGDAGAVLDYWQSDPAWERFNASVPANFQLADAEAFVATMCNRDRRSSPGWALVYQDSVVGVVSLVFEQDNRIAVIGYGIHGDLRGQGLCAEAVSAVVDQAFAHFAALQKIRAHTDAKNVPSARVLAKLGFIHEGTLRQNQFVKGRFVDEAIFGLTREDWVKRDRAR